MSVSLAAASGPFVGAQAVKPAPPLSGIPRFEPDPKWPVLPPDWTWGQVIGMPKHTNDRLQGTLDLVVLKTLDARGRMHGYAIGAHVARSSGDALRLEEGSLYPALHRMTHTRWLKAEWGVSENGRRARYYSITAAGRRQLAEEEEKWAALTGAVAQVLRTV